MKATNKMNMLLTRTTQDHVNLLWEPFATSTPLKIVPNNAKIGDLLHKQLIMEPDHLIRKPPKRLSTSSILQSRSKQSFPKKVKKNKSSAYLDVSSSSSDEEDSCESRKKLIIKVSSKKTRSLLGARKLESEETAVVNAAGVSARGKSDNLKKVTKDNTKSKSVNGKSRTKNANTATVVENAHVSSDEDKVFDESNKNAVNPAEEDIGNNENAEVVDGVTAKMPKVFMKAKNKGDNKQQAQKRLPKSASSNKLSKLLKRKGVNTINKSKKLSIKEKSSVNLENAITPLRLWGHKSNLSHQLFSDSREQEFINTLDLTTDDVNVSAGKTACSANQRKASPGTQITSTNQGKASPSKQITSTNQEKDHKGDEAKQERPVRRKQKPKEYWLPEKTSPVVSADGAVDKEIQSKRNVKTSSKNDDQCPTAGDVVVEEVKENRGSKKTNAEKGVKRRKRNVLKEKKLNEPDDEAVVTSTNELQKTELKSLGADKVAEVDNGAVTTDKTVFQLLSELSFKENEMGCSVVQCQNINNFKCGVLKLKTQSEFKCKTLHSNSHLGGVVVKGSIQMRVGKQQLELKEGDMAFVPPLTEWQATNTSDTESVFYYWCGRFK